MNISTLLQLSFIFLIFSCLLKSNPNKNKDVKKTVVFDTLSIGNLKNVGDNLIKHRITLINNSSQDIHFKFGHSKKNLDAFSVRSKEQWTSEFCNKNPYITLIYKKENPVVKLKVGHKYGLIFSTTKQNFILKEIDVKP